MCVVCRPSDLVCWPSGQTELPVGPLPLLLLLCFSRSALLFDREAGTWAVTMLLQEVSIRKPTTKSSRLGSRDIEKSAAWPIGATQRRLTWEHSKCTAECWESVFTASVTLRILELQHIYKRCRRCFNFESSKFRFLRGNLTSTSSRNSYPWLRGENHPFSGLMREIRNAMILGITVTPLRRRMNSSVWCSWREDILSKYGRAKKKGSEQGDGYQTHQARTLGDQKWDEATIECDRVSLPTTTRLFGKRPYWYQRLSYTLSF